MQIARYHCFCNMVDNEGPIASLLVIAPPNKRIKPPHGYMRACNSFLGEYCGEQRVQNLREQFDCVISMM